MSIHAQPQPLQAWAVSFTSLEGESAKVPTKASYKGTVPPSKDGVYLVNGKFSRFLSGLWRVPSSDVAKAAQEVRFDAFSSPEFRFAQRYRWTEIEECLLA